MIGVFPSLLLAILCVVSTCHGADTDLIFAEATPNESGGVSVTVTATKIAAASASITFGRLGSKTECPTQKMGIKQPEIFDSMLGETMESEALMNGVWKIVDTAGGSRVYTAEISAAMLRMLWQKMDARGMDHTVSITGGSASALLKACVTRPDEDDAVDVLDSTLVEMCVNPNRAAEMKDPEEDSPNTVSEHGCTVPRAMITGVYGTPGGDIHVSLETRVHPACELDPLSAGMHRLSNSLVRILDDDEEQDTKRVGITPMGASEKGCEDKIAVSDDLVECLQTWDVTLYGVAADANVIGVVAEFNVVGKTCKDEIFVQMSLSVDAPVVGNTDVPSPVHRQDVVTSTSHLHVQVRTTTENAKSMVHMRGLGEGAMSFAFNDGERNCLEIRSDHPSLLDDQVKITLLDAVLHGCTVVREYPEIGTEKKEDEELAHMEQQCASAGDVVLINKGKINHGFAKFMDARILYEDTTVSLCFTPDVDVFEAGTLEVSWAIKRIQTHAERREIARVERETRATKPSNVRWKPALELEIEEQERRKAREEGLREVGLDERHMGCHGIECNGTIIIPIHVGCQDEHFFVGHLNQCVPWPIYGSVRFMRVAWIPMLLVFIVIVLTCVICYGVVSSRHEYGDRVGHKIH